MRSLADSIIQTYNLKDKFLEWIVYGMVDLHGSMFATSLFVLWILGRSKSCLLQTRNFGKDPIIDLFEIYAQLASLRWYAHLY